MANDTSKQKRTPLIRKATPKAPWVWPKLTEPDYGSKDFPKPQGEYSVKVRFDGSDPAFKKFRAPFDAIVPKLEAMAEREFAALPMKDKNRLKSPTFNPIFTTVYDGDEDTGFVEMKFAMKASGTRTNAKGIEEEWSMKPVIVDRLNRPLPKGSAIWNGTIGQVCFGYNPDGYFIKGSGAYGVALRLEQVIVHDLKGPGQRDASAYDGAELDEYAGDAEDSDPYGSEQDDTAAGDAPVGSADF